MARRVGINRRLGLKKKKPSRKKTGGRLGKLVFSLIRLLLFVSVIGMLGFLSFKHLLPYIKDSEYLKVEKIIVKGVSQLDTSEVISLIKDVKGSFLFDINKNEIRQNILTNPWVKEVFIRRWLPGQLIINIRERKPLALVNFGQVYLVDDRGYLWQLKPNAYWNLPLVSGLQDTLSSELQGHRLKAEALVRLNSFLEEINSLIKNNDIPHISQIDFRGNEIVYLSFSSSLITISLNRKSMDKNLKHLPEILIRIKDKVENQPHHINLCFNNVAYVSSD